MGHNKYKLIGIGGLVLVGIFFNYNSGKDIFLQENLWSRVRPKNHQVATYPRPAWLESKPIMFTWNWDSAPIFQRRRGWMEEFRDEQYKKMRTEDAVRRLKEKGITLVNAHFYKGFGLEAEKEQLEDFAKLNALCKKYDIKVAAYIGSTICYETFLDEVPEAEEWFVPDFNGQPVHYPGRQYFRKRVYFMHPGFRAYMKKVIRLAINEYKVDLIHFDNTSERGKPPIFHHPMAIEDFRTYLKINYTPEQLKDRLGFSIIDHIVPPRWDKPIDRMSEPVFQLWTDFRCQQMSDFYEEMRAYIYELNPNVAVDNNPHLGNSGYNTMWEQGVDYARLLRNTEVMWIEEFNEGYVTDEGALVSRIRSYKIADKMNNRIFAYTNQRNVLMGEALTFNRNFLGSMGDMLTGYELTKEREEGEKENPYIWGTYWMSDEKIKEKHQYMQFLHKHFKHYQNTDNIADVAILHNYESMTYNNNRTYESTYLFEEALIEDHIPFDIIYNQHLNDLSKYKVLILANQQCLSQDVMDKIRSFVKNGGGLVATGESSLYNEFYRRRNYFGLTDLFNVPTPKIEDPKTGVWAPRTEDSKSGKITKPETTKNKVGKGRVVYIPLVKPVKQKPENLPMTSDYWIRPQNWEELINAVRWASGSETILKINAPRYVISELTTKQDGSEMQVHLLNYNVDNRPVAKNIEIKVSIPLSKKVSQVTLISPDDNRKIALKYNFEEGSVKLNVDSLCVYCLICISLE